MKSILKCLKNSDTMKKLKICIVIPGSVNDKSLWSGTFYKLYELLSNREDIELSFIEYDWMNAKLYKKIYIKFKKYIYSWASPQDFFVRKIATSLLNDALKNISVVDFFLFPSVACCADTSLIRSKGKVCVYTDCLMTDLDCFQIRKPLATFLSSYYKRKIKEDVLKTDIFFSQNEWSLRRFCEYCNFPSSKAYNVRFGVNLSFYEGRKDYTQQKMLIVLRKGCEKIKGLNILLKAMPKIRKRYPSATLDVVGSNVGSNVDGVICHYNEPRCKTVELFKQATLYVMPAHREPNGITYLEGLASKSPIVGLDRFAFPEFTGYGKWGFIVNEETADCIANVICKAFADSDKLMKMGLDGQKFVKENYAWDKTVDDMIKIMFKYV